MFRSNIAEGNVTLFGFPFHDDNETITDDINFIMGWDFNKPQVCPVALALWTLSL
jgi:predicted aldo/keto reductase-like oxidoreductase